MTEKAPVTQIKLEERTFGAHQVIYLNTTVPNEDLLIPFNMLSFLIKLPLHLFDKGMDPIIATGATYVKFLKNLGTETEVEVCMPVSAVVPEGNGVFYKEVEATTGTFVTAYHDGPRNTLGEIFENTVNFIQEQGKSLRTAPIILSLPNNKHMVPEEQLNTEIIFPVA